MDGLKIQFDDTGAIEIKRPELQKCFSTPCVHVDQMICHFGKVPRPVMHYFRKERKCPAGVWFLVHQPKVIDENSTEEQP